MMAFALAPHLNALRLPATVIHGKFGTSKIKLALPTTALLVISTAKAIANPVIALVGNVLGSLQMSVCHAFNLYTSHLLLPWALAKLDLHQMLSLICLFIITNTLQLVCWMAL